jgi:hypothetical protein
MTMKGGLLFSLCVAAALMTACDSNKADDGLIGSWIRMRDASEMRDRYVFGADGSFTFDENKPDEPQTEDHMTGTYVAANGVVTTTVTNILMPGNARLTFSYYANATQFSSAAMRARSGHTGIVGTWSGVRKLEFLDPSAQSPSGSEVEWEFRSDGSFRQTVTPFDGTGGSTTEGTWVGEGDGTFRATVDGSDKVVTLLDGEALVFPSQIWRRN